MKKIIKALLTAAGTLILGLLMCATAYVTAPWPTLRGTAIVVGIAGVALAEVVAISVIALKLVQIVETKSKRLQEAGNTPPTSTEPANHYVTKEQVIDLIMKNTIEPLAELEQVGETCFVVIELENDETFKLEVEKSGDFYTLKHDEPDWVTKDVMIEKEGVDTNKLTPADYKTGLVVEYDPDSIWAYLSLAYHSLTAEGVKDDRLGIFFEFDDLPPAPMAFDLRVERKARLERRGTDFFLAERGHAVVEP